MIADGPRRGRSMMRLREIDSTLERSIIGIILIIISSVLSFTQLTLRKMAPKPKKTKEQIEEEKRLAEEAARLAEEGECHHVHGADDRGD